MYQCTFTGCNERTSRCSVCHTEDILFCVIHSSCMKLVENVILCNKCISVSTCHLCEEYTKLNARCSLCNCKSDKCKEHANYIDYIGSTIGSICCPTCAKKYTCPKCNQVGRETRTCYQCKSQMCFACYDPSKWKVIQIGGGARHKVRHATRMISRVLHICTACQINIDMNQIYKEFPCAYCESIPQPYV